MEASPQLHGVTPLMSKGQQIMELGGGQEHVHMQFMHQNGGLDLTAGMLGDGGGLDSVGRASSKDRKKKKEKRKHHDDRKEHKRKDKKQKSGGEQQQQQQFSVEDARLDNGEAGYGDGQLGNNDYVTTTVMQATQNGELQLIVEK